MRPHLEMPDYNSLHCEFDAPVARVTLTRPALGNPLDAQLGVELQSLVREVERDSSIRTMLLTGAGGVFCSGIESDGFADWSLSLESLRACRVPVIVAVNGSVQGEGLLLALAGDWVLASAAVEFTDLTSVLAVIDGVEKAGEIGMNGFPPPAMRAALASDPGLIDAPLGAAQAAAWGLINECLEDEGELMARAGEVAERLALGPTRALVAARYLVDAQAGNSFEAQCRRELEVNRELRESLDGKEGVKAFLEKRPARFRGE